MEGYNQIYNKFWELCSEFKIKTNMNTNYMEYISALLYLKYYNEGNEQDFQEIYNERENYYINTKIDNALYNMRKKIGDETLFSDIQFRNIVFYRNLGEKNILTILIDEINRICNRFSKEYVAEQYEFAIKQAAISGDIKNTDVIFYTPKEIANVMVDMIIKKKDSKVYDPMCSSGNFLMVAMKNNDNRIKIFGEEQNIEYYNIFKTRILLSGIKNEKIIYQENKNIKDIKFDYILLNPPFSKRNWKEDIIYTPIFRKYGLSENSVGDYAYVLEMLEKLKDDGKMAVILPHGVLFRENEKKVRQNLIERNEIEAIIGLPENLFYGTRIPVIILIISKNRIEDTVLFIDASNDFKNERYKNVLTEEYQYKIVDTYHSQKEIEGYSRNVNINEIKGKDYNLSIKKYIRKKLQKKNIEEKQLIRKLKDLENEKDILEENIKDILDVLEVKSLQEEKNNESNRKNKKYDFDDKKIGKNIKELRIKKGYTQEELAMRLDISSRYISIIEHGMVGIRLQILAKICNILDVPIEEIIK